MPGMLNRLLTALRRRCAGAGAVVLLAAVLAACQHAPTQVVGSDDRHEDTPDDRERSPAAVVTVPTGAFQGWQPRPMPSKRWADFQSVVQDGQAGLQVQANASLSLLHLPLEPQNPTRTGATQVRWSWWLERQLPDADLAQSDASDSPVRLMLAFDGDRNKLSSRFHMVSELTRLVTGHDLPYATLSYVWAPQYPAGTVLNNPRSDRIRYLVVEQGPQRLGRWLHYERDFRADFERVFGEAPGPLIGVGLMTDADNTQGRTRAVYGPVALHTVAVR